MVKIQTIHTNTKNQIEKSFTTPPTRYKYFYHFWCLSFLIYILCKHIYTKLLPKRKHGTHALQYLNFQPNNTVHKSSWVNISSGEKFAWGPLLGYNVASFWLDTYSANNSWYCGKYWHERSGTDVCVNLPSDFLRRNSQVRLWGQR